MPLHAITTEHPHLTPRGVAAAAAPFARTRRTNVLIAVLGRRKPQVPVVPDPAREAPLPPADTAATRAAWARALVATGLPPADLEPDIAAYQGLDCIVADPCVCTACGTAVDVAPTAEICPVCIGAGTLQARDDAP